MKINFTHNLEDVENELFELIRGFYPFVELSEDGYTLDMRASVLDDTLKIEFTSDRFGNFKKFYYFSLINTEQIVFKREYKRAIKIALYRTLSFLSDVNLPYGCLTGIRPTKLYREYGDKAAEVFSKEFSVSEEKIELIDTIVKVQEPYLNKKGTVDIFINIPYCPTRCAYCSFVSRPLDKERDTLEPYIDKLILEIELLKKIVKKKKFKVEAVYIGGGTPTSIPHELFKKLIKKCKFGQKEFTVEAGRPDTIDIKKVKIMKRYGVTRVSVNPQSFNERTLKAIGRGHSIEDIIKAYNLCRKHFIVNMDLIAMLPGEGFDDFKFSVDKAVELNPENISIHTLYLKKGSKLKVEGYEHEDAEEAKKMISYAVYKLKSAGYVPYYMYRQKYTAGNLENVGYSKPDKICKYNIDIMEENTSILAAGANAISKKYTNDENLIERQAHVKEPGEYINRFDEIIKKTKEFWDYDK